MQEVLVGWRCAPRAGNACLLYAATDGTFSRGGMWLVLAGGARSVRLYAHVHGLCIVAGRRAVCGPVVVVAAATAAALVVLARPRPRPADDVTESC